MEFTCVEDHIDEVLIVVKSNAVAYPRAMVIHFQHTIPALTAMMRSFRLEHLAVATEALMASFQRAHHGKLLDFLIRSAFRFLIAEHHSKVQIKRVWLRTQLFALIVWITESCSSLTLMRFMRLIPSVFVFN